MGRHDPAIGARGGHGLAELTASPHSRGGEKFPIIRRMSDSLKTLAPQDYMEPVAGLLRHGGENLAKEESWPDYVALGFAAEHIPELIRMAMDEHLNGADGDGTEIWGPLHAWRTLAQLGAVEAMEPLVRLLDKLPDDEWLAEELPEVFSLVGPAAILVLADFMNDDDMDEHARISAPACLERMARDHPEYRDECAGLLTHRLTSYETNGSSLNGFIISSLIDLKAVDAIDAIPNAYFASCVDLSVAGDIEDVEIEMGLRRNRDTPRPKYHSFPALEGHQSNAHRNPVWDNTPGAGITNPFKHVGRNDPCPCGSGKKFKKCCLQ